MVKKATTPAKATESAPEFILALLGKDPELEWQIADIHDACGEQWTKTNLNNALDRLLRKGLVMRNVDPNRSAWWSIVV